MIGGVISSPPSNLFPLVKINKINEDTIYRIEIKKCSYYFYGRNKKYLLTIIDDEYYMLKLDESHEDFDITSIDGIEDSLSSTDLRENFRMLRELDNAGIIFILFDPNPRAPRACPQSLDLTSAQMKLLECNTSLKEKCDNLSLHLDYVYNLHPPHNKLVSLNKDPSALILCLYNESGCISSITIDIVDIVDGIITIDIDAMTDTVSEGNKYIKLLVCTVIRISSLLSEHHINRITSTAMNPMSFYLLMTYFGGIVSDIEDNTEFFNVLEKKGIIINSETDYRELFELYEEYEEYEKSGDIFRVTIDIELTRKNIKKATAAFPQILAEIVC